MAKFVHLSRIYLSDDEYFELLSPKNVSRRELLRMGRSRGHVFSEKSNEADVRSRLATLPSDWKTISQILTNIARPDPEERKAAVTIGNCAPENDIEKIVDSVKDDRNKKHGEVFNLVKIADDRFRVEVTYTDIDLSRAVIYQRRERKLSVEVTKQGETVHFLHNANDRANQVVDSMKALLTIKPSLQAVEHKISLSGIRHAALRTKFFTQLIKSVPGYKYQNATHLTVDRRLQEAAEEETANGNGDNEQEAKSAASLMQGLVNKVSLDGEQVIATDLYQQASNTGYFITNISWSCVDDADPRYHIDCEAGFNDPIAADKFSFDVVRKWQYSADAPDRPETIALTLSDRRKLTDLLESAAAKSLETVSKEYKKMSNDPAPDKQTAEEV